jgi:CRP-like cAMP-binding protein
VTEDLRARVLAGRAAVKGQMAPLYQPLDAGSYLSGLSLMENALFGVMATSSGTRADMVAATVGAVLTEQGLKTRIAMLSLEEETLLGGANLPAPVRERVGYLRAAIKRPDILVLNTPLASHDPDTRAGAIAHLRAALPHATLIQIEPQFDDLEPFDLVVEMHQGRVAQDTSPAVAEAEASNTPDLLAKYQAIKQTVFFSGVDDKQLRLLAFSAQRFAVPADEMIFHMHDDPSDGVYLILHGEAAFFFPQPSGEEQHIRTSGPGSLVGELSLVLGEPRTLSMRAVTDLSGLRIGAEEFLSVIQNDAATSFKFLQLIAGYAASSNVQRAADLDQS